MISELKIKEYKEKSSSLISLVLSNRQLCDIELIVNGGFAPLNGFLNKSDYSSVIENMRLENGDIWPIPITLDISINDIEQNNLIVGSKVALRDHEGFHIATLDIQDMWKVDKEKEAKLVYGSKDDHHPGVYYLYNSIEEYYLGGRLELAELPKHYDYQLLRHTPKELKEHLEEVHQRDVKHGLYGNVV